MKSLIRIKMFYITMALAVLLSGCSSSTADTSSPVTAAVVPPGLAEPVVDVTFNPAYSLERNAANYPGPAPESPVSSFETIEQESTSVLFHGQEPTERLIYAKKDTLPIKQFSVEFWLVDHVNQPVGTLVMARNDMNSDPVWAMGYFEREIVLQLGTSAGMVSLTATAGDDQKGWKKWWYHLVGSYDGEQLRIYVNGELAKEGGTKIKMTDKDSSSLRLELASYMTNEPYMQTANLVKNLRLYDQPLSPSQIKERFEQLCKQVTEGILISDKFHFNAGPYLNYATQTSINLVWETWPASRAVIEYGKGVPKVGVPWDKTIEMTEYKTIHEVALTGLEPETPYFYTIHAFDEAGNRIESGIHSFGTAVKPESAFSFALIGDTEARPQINDRVSKLIWDKRPNFMVHVGDLTDGGKEPNKFEWNYEYFSGMNQLIGRVPVFPVPGNGESDLYWYKKYHMLPADEAYYTFTYGNTEFFMLNSADSASLQKGGVQYEWLKEKLTNSTAIWKIAAHHHAPYSSDEDDYGNTWAGPSTHGDQKLKDIVDLYEAHGVDIVLFGHLHSYDRSWPLKAGKVDLENGVIYIQSGGAGGNLEDFDPVHTWFSREKARGFHYLMFNVYKNTLSGAMYDIDGSMRDTFEISK